MDITQGDIDTNKSYITEDQQEYRQNKIINRTIKTYITHLSMLSDGNFLVDVGVGVRRPFCGVFLHEESG